MPPQRLVGSNDDGTWAMMMDAYCTVSLGRIPEIDQPIANESIVLSKCIILNMSEPWC